MRKSPPTISPKVTIQDSDNISRYFSDIRDFEPLSKEQERELIKLVQKDNDQKAMTILINANVKFVVSVAKRYQGQGVPLLDLVSEGNIGLIEATKRFDGKKDNKLFSYAVWWITMAMFKSLFNGNRNIRLPDNRALMVSHIKKEIDILEQDLGRFPTLEELHAQCKVSKIKDVRKSSITDIQEAILYGGRMPSLHDKKVGADGSEEEMHTTMEDESFKIDESDGVNSMNIDLNRFLFHLSQYEYDVLCLTMGLNGQDILRSNDMAKALKLTEKDIVRLKLRAIRKLKKVKNIKSMKDYL